MSELEEKIDVIIQKACKDLKSRIMKEVVKGVNKSLKEQVQELKSNSTSKSKKQLAISSTGRGRGRGKKLPKNKDDSDSDYYDE